MSGLPETAVITKLKATTEIAGLVGVRIHPRIAPQGDGAGDKPYLVVLRPEGQVNTQLASGPGEVSWTPIIVCCVGETYEQSRTLSQPVVDALCPQGWTGSQMWGAVEVGSCQVDDTFDRSSLPQLADEIGAPVEFVALMLEHSTKEIT